MVGCMERVECVLGGDTPPSPFSQTLPGAEGRYVLKIERPDMVEIMVDYLP